MKLWESPVNQDEMINDAYPSVAKPEAGCLVFEGRYVDKSVDEDNPSAKVSVVDVVENFNLVPYPDLKKTAFVGWAKQFMPKRRAQLASSNPGRIDQFMADAKKFASYLTAHFAEFEFYMGQSGDPDDYLMAMTTENDKPVFYFLELACDASKC
jgi:hypothetical protein